MKNVIGIVLLAVLGVGVGFFAGAYLTTPTEAPAERAGASMEEQLADAQRAFGAGADTMRRRQSNSMLGAGIGGALGVAGGIALAYARGNRQRRA